eukprot:39356-Prymnesium_polylepis.1
MLPVPDAGRRAPRQAWGPALTAGIWSNACVSTTSSSLGTSSTLCFFSQCSNAAIATRCLSTFLSAECQSVAHSNRVNLTIDARYCLRCSAGSTLVKDSIAFSGCNEARNTVGSVERSSFNAAPSDDMFA